VKVEPACSGPMGEAPISAELVTQMYQELRRIAAACLRGERPNHTLQPTALINEAWLRLASAGGGTPADRTHYLALAAHVMREVLVDYARARNRFKRGGGVAPVSLEDTGDVAGASDVDVMALDDALDSLEQIDTQQRQIVELRYFGGLSIEETAQVLAISPATVKRDWRIARAWLHRELSSNTAHES
jgi:RNA polymerase sigma factor (TIGR02999 family)